MAHPLIPPSRPRRSSRLRPRSLAAACCLACTTAGAQSKSPADTGSPSVTQQLAPVTVTAVRPPASASSSQVGGFGDTPLWQQPLQEQTYTAAQLRDINAQRLSDITTLNASVSDSYNAGGYWDIVSVRGYTLDNQNNYRREGLPISAETSIPLDNKSAVELLEGASGMQAGVSAPGGLIDLLVKRPTGTVRTASLQTNDRSVLATVDLSQRFGEQDRFGLRLNAAAEHLDPQLRDDRGHRHLLALAGDWQLSSGSLVEAEFEISRRSQPSQPGFSLLGSKLPPASSVDPRTNLNNQPWSLPVNFDADTGTLRWRQSLADGWRMVATAGTQLLKSDDRLAYAFGCNKESNGLNVSTYCSDGSFNYYNFRSDDERRRTNAFDLAFSGTPQTGMFSHDLTLGVLASHHTLTTRPMADDVDALSGYGNVNGQVMVPLPTALASATVPNTDLDNRATETYVRDKVAWASSWTLWWGLRHSALNRSSVQTDGTQGVSYQQSFTTPWLSLSDELAPGRQAYVSWGEGVETYTAPSQFNGTPPLNAEQPVPAARSFQSEVGFKFHEEHWDGSLAYFHIDRPSVDLNQAGFYALDGKERHQGLEAQTTWHTGAWSLAASGMLVDAKIHGSDDPNNDGQRPVNVPDHALKLYGEYRLSRVPGLSFNAALVHEGRREILLPNSLTLPTWTRVDLGVVEHWDTARADWTLRAGLYNAFNRRAWQESPTQYQHVYLYPLAARTLYLSLQASW